MLKHVRFFAVATIVSIAACSGGSSAPPISTGGLTPQSTTGRADPLAVPVIAAHAKAASSMPLKPGVNPQVLAGWSARQISAEQNRKSGVPFRYPDLPTLNAPIAGPIGTAPVPITRLSDAPAALSDARTVQAVRSASGGTASALILYDTAGQWGYLGELYAMATANLAGHFGTVTTEPVTSYTAGQVNHFTATIYVGSTYYDLSTDPIPMAFYNDVAATTHPVIWMNDNIWNFAFRYGTLNFDGKYGWDPTNSYFAPNGSVGNITQVSYKAEPLTRNIPAGDDGGVLHPYVLGGGWPAVTTLATAHDASNNSTSPWAIRSGNLTYIGEIPFAYVSETDRIIALEDLLFDALAPTTATQHRAMLRLEDIDAGDDPAQLQTVATWLYTNHVSYGFNVIPQYLDPKGYYNNGVPVSTSLAQDPSLVTVLKYMQTHGGTMIDEGYTHQYSNVNNPYTGVSGDDAEFFLAHVNAGNSVIWDGPIPGDSTAWVNGRLTSAAANFAAVGLALPSLWVTPHYFATDVDYRAISAKYAARYERSLYFSGDISGAPVNYAQYIGEFFPYVVHDIYGSEVLPENLGDYEPVSLNNNPVRLPANLVAEAQDNLAVRDGFASVFYDPSYGTTPLQQIVTGIQGVGYTFVAPSSVK